MEGIGAEVSQKVKSAIKAKLVELGVYVDEELPDYIMVMVANKRSKSEMIEDLQLFLGTHTEKFISWLLQVLQKLQEVTLASLDAKKATTSSAAEKEKLIKKRKTCAAEAEPESAKKDRKKKAEVTKKDTGAKKVKKSSNLKNKSTKSDVVKNVDKRPSDKIDTSVKEKKEIVDKSKEQASTSVVKNIPLTLPSTIRSNPKPVLMVSDEDDEDFINIRADAEADLLVSELQEEIRPSPQTLKQLTVAPTVKSSGSGLLQLSDKPNTTSQESSHSVPSQVTVREPIISTQKDVRLHHVDECGTNGKDVRLKSQNSPNPLWYRQETPDVGSSSSSHLASSVSQRVTVKSVGQISTKLPTVKRTPAIPPPEASSHHSHGSSINQIRLEENKNTEVQRVQPASKITPVSRLGTIKSRLGKKPDDKEELQPCSERPRARGVTSVVRVKGRPKVPLSAQANRNLILRAVAEAQKSVATAPIRTEPNLRSPGLLTRKNRNQFSKIAVTLPNLRMISAYQQAGRPLPDDIIRNQAQIFQNHPELIRNMPQPFQARSQLIQNQLQPIQNRPQPIQNQPQPIQNQPQPTQNQPQLIQNQPQLIQNQPQLIQTQPQLIRNQPQPDIVANLHEGISTNIGAVSGNIVDGIMLTESISSPTVISQARHLMNPTNPEIDGHSMMEGVENGQHPNHEVVRTLGCLPYSEGNTRRGPSLICSVPQEASIDMLEKPVSQVESPVETRTSSPQFFVTLSGYDPCSINGAGRVVRSDLSVKSRCFFMSEGDDMEVEQEYMDEGIGEEDSKQGIENIEETELTEDTLEKRTRSSGPIIFRKVAPETCDDADPSMKVKNTERCRFWPACRLGERCEYHHPTIPCKAFPGCKFGDKCLYIHPNCKFDAACTRKDCPFTHAIPRSLVAAPIPAPVRVSVRPLSVQCRFFPKCTNVNCKFYHPKPCRFGKACNKYDCPFMHEREQLPSKEKLKWICPAKA